MKAVIQEERSGCGLASVAVLANLSYNEVKRTANSLGMYAKDKALWSDTKYVRRLLAHYGLNCSKTEVAFKSWESLPAKALLSIKWRRENGTPFWHWVVFWRSPEGPVVLDPKKALKRNTRTDFGRMKPKWFIEVH